MGYRVEVKSEGKNKVLTETVVKEDAVIRARLFANKSRTPAKVVNQANPLDVIVVQPRLK